MAGRYRILHICVDREEGGEDEVRAMRDRVSEMETELRGFHFLGTDETEGWPTVAVYDNAKRTPEARP